MNHAPGAGLIAQPVNQQSSSLSLYYGCPENEHEKIALHYSCMDQAIAKADRIPWRVHDFCFSLCCSIQWDSHKTRH